MLWVTATGNRVLRKAGKGRQGLPAWCYLHAGGLEVYVLRGKTQRILSLICELLC